VAKHNLKRFNIVACPLMNLNPKSLIKLEEIPYHLIQVFLAKVILSLK